MNNKEQKYCVYMHTNKINNHFYIGITSLSPNKRYGKNGSNYKECTYFWNAIQKYGWDNFEHKILFDGLTKEEACNKEIELISKMKMKYPNCCYNILLGGDLGRAGMSATEECKEKFRGANNPVARSVICIETNQIFDTETEAAKFYDLDRSNLGRACRTGIACGKLENKKLHWAYYNKNTKEIQSVQIKTRCRRVYCMTTGVYFNSLKEGAQHYNVSRDSVWYSCSHGGVVSHGYAWKYADDIECEDDLCDKIAG